jgi:hypothetical protein
MSVHLILVSDLIVITVCSSCDLTSSQVMALTPTTWIPLQKLCIFNNVSYLIMQIEYLKLRPFHIIPNGPTKTCQHSAASPQFAGRKGYFKKLRIYWQISCCQPKKGDHYCWRRFIIRIRILRRVKQNGHKAYETTEIVGKLKGFSRRNFEENRKLVWRKLRVRAWTGLVRVCRGQRCSVV